MANAERTCFALAEVLLRKTRTMPFDGDVAVGLGDLLKGGEVLASGRRSANPVVAMVGATLGVPAKDVNKYLKRWAGEPVQRDEILAEKKGPFGLGHKVFKAPVDGIIVSGPHGVGEVVISPSDEEVVIRAQVPGRVVGIVPQRGAVIETLATCVQGVGGYGSEAAGSLHMASGTAEDELEAAAPDDQLAGKLLVAGYAGLDAMILAIQANAAGLIVGGLNGDAYAWLHANRPSFVIMITDGAGPVPMSSTVFELLRNRAGAGALLSLEGQAPELVVPVPGPHKATGLPQAMLAVGTRVRVEAGRYAGNSGHIRLLPPVPRRLSSGLVARVAEVTLDDGELATVARDNLVLIS